MTAGDHMSIETLLRDLASQALAVLIRRHGDFDRCEDALQEALLAAADQWSSTGLPDNPKGWLITVASRRWVELWRNDAARARRELKAVALEPPAPDPAGLSDDVLVDDSLSLMLLCCHSALTVPSQVALSDRVNAVLRVLYLIFTEGSTASSGDRLQRVELSTEAIRLTRQLHASRPDDGEIAGLLALMLLTDARRSACTRADATLVPLDEQDRSLWNHAAIAEGVELVTSTLSRNPVGPFQLQAAHLLEMSGAHDAYREAARRTLSVPEQHYLLSKARGGADPS